MDAAQADGLPAETAAAEFDLPIEAVREAFEYAVPLGFPWFFLRSVSRAAPTALWLPAPAAPMTVTTPPLTLVDVSKNARSILPIARTALVSMPATTMRRSPWARRGPGTTHTTHVEPDGTRHDVMSHESDNETLDTVVIEGDSIGFEAQSFAFVVSRLRMRCGRRG